MWQKTRDLEELQVWRPTKGFVYSCEESLKNFSRVYCYPEHFLRKPSSFFKSGEVEMISFLSTTCCRSERALMINSCNPTDLWNKHLHPKLHTYMGEKITQILHQFVLKITMPNHCYLCRPIISVVSKDLQHRYKHYLRGKPMNIKSACYL